VSGAAACASAGIDGARAFRQDQAEPIGDVQQWMSNCAPERWLEYRSEKLRRQATKGEPHSEKGSTVRFTCRLLQVREDDAPRFSRRLVAVNLVVNLS
jgi:hypothetical protein